MHLIAAIGSIPHDVISNVLDLIAFVLITPELIGESRLSLLTSWIKRILGGENRTLVIVASVFIAGRIARFLGVPRGIEHAMVLAGIAILIGALLMLINRFVRSTPSRQVMLVTGAALFVAARLIGIFAAMQTG